MTPETQSTDNPSGDAVRPQRDLLWNQYALHVDLYKFYVDATIKINALHYAITGAILSFYFTRPEISTAKWSLVLPAVLSVGLGALFVYGASLLTVVRNDMFKLRDLLALEVAPEFRVLSLLLQLFGIVQLFTAAALIWLLVAR